MIEAALRAAGYRTGLYTSPHLHTFRERIQVGGEFIPEADVMRLVEEMRPLLAKVPDVTTFEVMTGIAFAWFAERGVEWAVLEVGLGGRLDATNVVTPVVAVITSISLDHTAILGETHAQIAKEKAGDKTSGSVLASDAMLPFNDVVETAATGGVTAIIQPGGSIRDEDSIKSADEHNIAMVFTGERHFRH